MSSTLTQTSSLGSPATIPPRLLDLRAAAAYLSCSYWTVRDWVAAGYLPVVDLPPVRPREGERPRKTLRRVLLDVRDLDAFIEGRKIGGIRDVQSRAGENDTGQSRRKRGAVPTVCPPGGRP